ncbi:tyrosine-protein phosphatase [Paucilactobacillus kaifaensis]|uniref:tyrosine-protein phosphatase n=1 Tax=Paucilactobacillus kaifaensis TaxID=2559921 RepID=UPI0010FA218E|nr:tyrosine-protein phosphatase [Paucilactobacillus kaifaensis]
MEYARLLPIQNGHNFRDLGGYTTTDGHTVKWGHLIRSGHLNTLDQHDLDILDRLQVKYDLDFRAPEEITSQPDRVPLGAAYTSLPVFQTDETDASHSQEQIMAEYSGSSDAGYNHMLDVYRDMVTTPQAKKSYQAFFSHLLGNSDHNAVLFHCTAGKDRTGMGAVFLLSALNVDRPTIIRDYLLTNSVTKNYVESRIKKIKQAGLSTAFAENTRALSTVSPDYINTALAEIDNQYGSVNNYLHQYLEISADQMKDLQKLYLD